MEFCPKCGSILLVEGDKTPVCAKCGHKYKGKLKLQASEKMNVPERIAVVDEAKMTTYPIVEISVRIVRIKKHFFGLCRRVLQMNLKLSFTSV